jgi:hypothetical protein
MYWQGNNVSPKFRDRIRELNEAVGQSAETGTLPGARWRETSTDALRVTEHAILCLVYRKNIL